MEAAVRLYWLPLGAGGRWVRQNGRLFEAIASRRQHRPAQQLLQSALEVRLGPDTFVIEMTPAWPRDGIDRGVVREGSVGMSWLGRSVWFRYEVRRWPGGLTPDVAEAVDSPLLLSEDAGRAERVLDLVPRVPALTWGRDELDVGEMWSANSLCSWLLASSGHELAEVSAPGGVRAPGWTAGLVLAARDPTIGRWTTRR